MGIWFNKRGEEYYGETEKSWWKSYIDRLFNEHKEKKPIDHPDGSVTEEKIANDSVTDSKIGFREVKYPIKGTTLRAGLTAHLSNLISEVDTANNNHKLHKEAAVLDHPDGSVTKEKLASGSVTTVKLGSGSVTAEKLADNSVTDEKIGNRWVQYSAVVSEVLPATITNHLQFLAEDMGTVSDSVKNNKAEFDSHTSNKNNPHSVTKAQVGLGNVTNDKQATEKEFNLRTDIYEVDISKVGADNNILYVTVPNITAFSDLDGKVINVYTGIYSNNKTQTVWLNVNGYGAKPIRRVIPDSSYETSTYNAYEINRYTVMQLYIGGTSVYWVNAVNNFANIKKNPDAADGDIVGRHLTVGTRLENAAIGVNSLVSGDNNAACGGGAAVIGGETNTANGSSCTVVGGGDNFAGGNTSSIIGGAYNTTEGNYNIIAGGTYSTTSGNYSAALNCYEGNATSYNTVIGRYNDDSTAGASSGTSGDAFIVGIGDSTARKNGFRVAYDGNCYAATAMNSTGADYAECFEWTDGNHDNEDRIGFMTAFEGDKIRFANENDPVEIIGVVSAIPAIVGDNYADEWCGKYLKDKYGRLLTEHKVYEAEYRDVEAEEEIELTAEEISEIQEEITNDETLTDYEKAVKLSNIPTTKTVKVTKQELVHEAYEADEYVLNPDYNADEEYIPRLKRKEYSAVGTHGKLAVRDDGTCEVGGFCRSGNGGIATKSDSGFYVMERIDDETVRIYIK